MITFSIVVRFYMFVGSIVCTCIFRSRSDIRKMYGQTMSKQAEAR